MSDEFNNDYTTDTTNEVSVPEEKKGMSIASFVLGLCGLIAWCLPLFGYPVSIVGIILGCIGIKKGGKVFAIIGIILSALCLVVTIVNSILGVAMVMDSMNS